MRIPLSAAVSGAVTAIGSVTGDMIEQSNVSLKTACAVGLVVFTGVWWLSSKLQKIDSRLEEGDKRFERIEHWMEKHSKR